MTKISIDHGIFGLRKQKVITTIRSHTKQEPTARETTTIDVWPKQHCSSRDSIIKRSKYSNNVLRASILFYSIVVNIP